MHPMGVKDYFFINVSVETYKMNMSFYYMIVIKRDKWRGWKMSFTDLLGERWQHKKTKKELIIETVGIKCGLWPFLCFLFYFEIPFPMPRLKLALPGLVL